MRSLLRAAIFGVSGYLVGVLLTLLVRGGSFGDEVCVIFGYVLVDNQYCVVIVA